MVFGDFVGFTAISWLHAFANVSRKSRAPAGYIWGGGILCFSVLVLFLMHIRHCSCSFHVCHCYIDFDFWWWNFVILILLKFNVSLSWFSSEIWYWLLLTRRSLDVMYHDFPLWDLELGSSTSLLVTMSKFSSSISLSPPWTEFDIFVVMRLRKNLVNTIKSCDTKEKGGMVAIQVSKKRKLNGRGYREWMKSLLTDNGSGLDSLSLLVSTTFHIRLLFENFAWLCNFCMRNHKCLLIKLRSFYIWTINSSKTCIYHHRYSLD